MLTEEYVSKLGWGAEALLYLDFSPCSISPSIKWG